MLQHARIKIFPILNNISDVIFFHNERTQISLLIKATITEDFLPFKALTPEFNLQEKTKL